MKKYECKDVSAEKDRQELMRDAFIGGMILVAVRQTLMLENRELTFQQAYEQARAQEMACKNAEIFLENNACNRLR